MPRGPDPSWSGLSAGLYPAHRRFRFKYRMSEERAASTSVRACPHQESLSSLYILSEIFLYISCLRMLCQSSGGSAARVSVIGENSRASPMHLLWQFSVCISVASPLYAPVGVDEVVDKLGDCRVVSVFFGSPLSTKRSLNWKCNCGLTQETIHRLTNHFLYQTDALGTRLRLSNWYRRIISFLRTVKAWSKWQVVTSNPSNPRLSKILWRGPDRQSVR